MRFVMNDGGRAAAGYKGTTGDCTTRAIAIAAELPYQVVYSAVNEIGKAQRGKRKGSARTGISNTSIRRMLTAMGWRWVPTMQIGSGCKVHLRAEELPGGRLIVAVSKHMVAVIDGVVHDTYDCTRDGTRCVYGYFTPEAR